MAGFAALDKRLGALQSANADEGPKIAAATQAVQNVTAEVKNSGRTFKRREAIFPPFRRG